MKTRTTDRLNRLEDFALLRATLYHSSPDANILSSAEHWQVFPLCDGYGQMSREQLTELGLEWDWSHVRDSSPDAIAKAAAKVRSFLV